MPVCSLHGLQAGCALAAANAHEKSPECSGLQVIEK